MLQSLIKEPVSQHDEENLDPAYSNQWFQSHHRQFQWQTIFLYVLIVIVLLFPYVSVIVLFAITADSGTSNNYYNVTTHMISM